MTANNYAKALYELEIPRADISEAAEIYRNSPELAEVLASPAVTREEKRRVIDLIFPKSTVGWIKYLCDHSNANRLLDIAEAYFDYSDKAAGVIHASLVCVEAPDGERLKKLETFVTKKFGASKAVFNITIDKSLIGGFILTAGGVEFDRSLKGGLNDLKNSIKQGK